SCRYLSSSHAASSWAITASMSAVLSTAPSSRSGIPMSTCRTFLQCLQTRAVFRVDDPDLRVAVGLPHAGPLLRDRDGFAGTDVQHAAVGRGERDAAFEEVHELVDAVRLLHLEPGLAGPVHAGGEAAVAALQRG